MRPWLISGLVLAMTGPTVPATDVSVPASQLTASGFHAVGEQMHHAERPYTGRLVVTDETGHRLEAVTYRDGLQDGLAETWYANGRRQGIGLYAAGRRTGRHQGWWPNGQPKYRSDFAADVYHGEVTEWDQAGRLARRAHYLAGQEQGLQQLWRADGTVFASYTVVGNRIYGLYGSKSCAAR